MLRETQKRAINLYEQMGFKLWGKSFPFIINYQMVVWYQEIIIIKN